MSRMIDADALKPALRKLLDHYRCRPDDFATGKCVGLVDAMDMVDAAPTIDAIPVEWLNKRHRKCCEDGDTDLMDAITVLCNEYHVWQKEQEGQRETD